MERQWWRKRRGVEKQDALGMVSKGDKMRIRRGS